MYFTNTPSLNSMEAIMQRPPGGNQRGGGRIRRAYQFNKADCDCRLCLYHRKKKGCSMEICPVLDARLTCGAASFYEAFMRHLPTHDIRRFKDGFHISTTERMMPL